MVVSTALYTSPTTGGGIRRPEPVEQGPVVDHHGTPHLPAQALDKHDVWTYTLYNAPFIGLAGLVAGLQEAYYQFDRMPPSETRLTMHQASKLYGTVARKTLLGTTLGAVFCATEAYMENKRGTHDMWNGMAAGAAAGLAFGMARPMPQPIAWPLMFAGVAAAADIVGEKIPAALRNNRTYGPLENRENWGDPAPPRPPILETMHGARPMAPAHFWRGG